MKNFFCGKNFNSQNPGKFILKTVFFFVPVFASVVLLFVFDFMLLYKKETKIVKRDIAEITEELQSHYVEYGKFPATKEEFYAMDGGQKRDPWNRKYIYFYGKDKDFTKLFFNQKDFIPGLPFAIGTFGADGIIGGRFRAKDIFSWKIKL